MSGWERFVYVVSLVAVVVAGVIYINYVDDKRDMAERESDRRWCSIVGTIEQAYNDPASPPQSEIGRQLAADFHDLYAGLDCPA